MHNAAVVCRLNLKPSRYTWNHQEVSITYTSRNIRKVPNHMGHC